MSVTSLLAQRPEPKIVNSQYVIGGEKFTRTTTFIKAIADTYNLQRWQQRMVALGLAARPDLFASVASCRPDEKGRLNELCESAIEAAQGTVGRNLGTALHAFCERVDLGEDIRIPAPYDADVAAYRAALVAAEVQILPEYVEGVIVNRTLGVAGRFDRMVMHPAYGLCVLDLKTGAMYPNEFAPQLAIYANADDLYDPATDTCTPMPAGVNKHFAIVAHLPAGEATCTLHVVDIEAGWEMANVTKQVRDWWKKKDVAFTLAERSVAKTTDAERRAALVARVETIRDHSDLALRDLANNWPQGVATFKDSEAQTDDELDLIEAVLVEVEKQHSVPFPAAPVVEDDPWDGLPEPLPKQLPTVVYAPKEDCDRLIEDLRQLEPDFLAAVEAVTAEAKVPNLKTGKAEPRHLTLVRDAIRGVDITRRLTRLHTEGDEAMHAAFYSYCRISDPAFVDEDAWLNALRVLSALGQTVFFELVGDDTWRLIERPDPAA